LVEHKSSYQELTPFAVQRYIYAIMEKYQHPKTKALPLVLPIVVYHGKKPYAGPTDVRDLIDAPRDWIDAYYAKPFHLIDLNLIEDEELRSHRWAGIYQLIQKHIRTRNALNLLKSIEASLIWFEKEGAASFVEAVLHYTLEAGVKGSRNEFVTEARKILSPPIGDKMMSIADSLREEGWLEGREEGFKEGIQLKEQNIAKKMFAQGYGAKDVASILGMSLVDIEKLQGEPAVAL
jgi:predicted transposase/invertase (TIGR01784 family)